MTTILLVFLYTVTYALPLFAAVDECDMLCCQLISPCCDLESERKECHCMVQEQDTEPILLPVAPCPSKTKTFCFPVLNELYLSHFEYIYDNNWYHDYSVTIFEYHHKIPHYYLTHSLLI